MSEKSTSVKDLWDVSDGSLLMLKQTSFAAMFIYNMRAVWKIAYRATPAFLILFPLAIVGEILHVFYEIYELRRKGITPRNVIHFVVAEIRSLAIVVAIIGTLFFFPFFMVATSKLFFGSIALGAVYYAWERYDSYKSRLIADETFRALTFKEQLSLLLGEPRTQIFILCCVLTPCVGLVFAFPPGGLVTLVFGVVGAVLSLVVAAVIANHQVSQAFVRLKNKYEGFQPLLRTNSENGYEVDASRVRLNSLSVDSTDSSQTDSPSITPPSELEIAAVTAQHTPDSTRSDGP